MFPIRPMLAQPSSPFDSKRHLFEIKWDGTRCISFVDSEQLLQNRRLVNITSRYPEIRIELNSKQAVLDGEIVVMGKKGKPDFRLLQQRDHIGDTLRKKLLSERIPADYIVFDILYLDNTEITHLPLLERKQILTETLVENEHVHNCDYIIEKGMKYFEEAIKKGIEGVMAKDIGSPYLVGKRSNYWLKIKKILSIDALVCGITEGTGERGKYFGALVLGCYEKGKLRYIGNVGSGFSREDLIEILDLVKGLEGPCPFDVIPEIKAVKQWLKPGIVVEVMYNELTADKKLRAPRFEKIRFDKPPEECTI